MNETRILLGENELPRAWYNIRPDLPKPLPPPLHPATLEPVVPDDLAPIFPQALIEQEMSAERWIDIPDEVREIYKMWRPTPLQRAVRLERFLGTPARIYFKNESVSPAGSHKPNTAVVQAYYNKREGVKRLATETGAGQWGSALSLACRLFGLECTVYMVRASYEQKPYRRLLMETWGATVHASPSRLTHAGLGVLAANGDSPGSLGIAISEAVEDAATHGDTKYALGSVLNHVLLHQSVIGLETRAQLEKAGVEPDILVGCVGGGSNFSGFVFPFVADKMSGKRLVRLVAVEPSACPSLTEGLYRYDHGDAVGLTPLLKMHTLGHDFVPPVIHAGGLRYHGDAPLLCLLRDEGLIEAVAVGQRTVFEAGILFSRTEGIVPAPESAHAIKVAIDEALRCRESGEKKTICFALSGHGHFDLAGYEDYLAGRLESLQAA
jgi:tryptophan synthase beta chain